ncbi:EcsC family protein [Luteipulveratus sp. YIM 133132]|uniref:EcsC family protein n=1 Tax=Luteipulveratus flavus TaxID=3031728 RepID=A0ABT6C5K6_9MICO|nr:MULTISPECIES: EcsC family protein [unclassified Luteipulveratus]MDE9366500.1 EcsC family protein [Luteipulveratus sp. YIM 133132]MDF8264226.1 EcsC family protein [Luteipulveratus sp. YIM 133296]
MFGLGKKKPVQTAPAKVDDGPLATTATNLAERLLDVGFDGRAGFKSARAVADAARAKHQGNVEQAIDEVVGDHRRLVAGGGFITGLGGFVTMPVALPANVFEFYVLATRTTAAIAHLRGHDIDQHEIRSAVLLTLIGAEADDLLKKAGVVSTGRLANLAAQRLPGPALMVVNKAVGFRLISQVGRKAFSKMGKGIPLAGGVVGAGLDVYLFNKIAAGARREFPPKA